ncbi:MAG TPA: ATP-dependent 6-phosphofructokinase [Spirochaetia bacterium]|nr:ATP-dependent 6-phosphofructokinase [Spirochaetia bacterium]
MSHKKSKSGSKKSAARRRLTFAILTSGGDCPGLNAAIRGVAKAAYGLRDSGSDGTPADKVVLYGIANGYRGLIEGDSRLMQSFDFDGILTLGGTIFGTSREKPFDEESALSDTEAARRKPDAIRETYEALSLDCLVVLGGNGTMKTANRLARNGLNVIGLPKTIDNDIFGTDMSFGFHSAVDIATDAIDRLHSTAHSHNRVMVIETMGHSAGWLALNAGIAGGGDVILIPEIPYEIDSVVNHLKSRAAAGKRFSIVVVAEGALSRQESKLSAEELERLWLKKGIPSAGYRVARAVEAKCGMETRVTVLGYQQRGGTPSAYDRVLATRFGTAAAQLLFRREYGCMVAVEGTEIITRPLEEVAGKLKLVPQDHTLVQTARRVGTCFGDT